MRKFLAPAATVVLAVAGCKDVPTAGTAPTASALHYTVTSPFCGPVTYTLQFSVDGVSIGSELLKHGQASKVYEVSPGKHLIGARVVNWSLSLDTTVTIASGQSFNRVIDLYCS